MRTRIEYRIVDSEPPEVIEYVAEWLLAYEFVVESKEGLTKKHLRGKKISRKGLIRTDLARDGDAEAVFEFEASRIRTGTDLVGEYYARLLDNKRELDLVTLRNEFRDSNPDLWYFLEFAKSLVARAFLI